MKRIKSVLALLSLLAAGLVPAAVVATPASAAPAPLVTPMLATGDGHTLALKADGTVWAWGRGNNGQLGTGNWNHSLTPVPVMESPTEQLAGVTAIAAGYAHSVALKSDGTVWTWGRGIEGQLGHPDAFSIATPKKIATVSGITQIAAGDYHTVMLKGQDYTVFTTGLNDDGQLGNGSTTKENQPVRVEVAGFPLNVAFVAAGSRHTIVRELNGTVSGWGDNLSGQIGSGGTNAIQATPLGAAGFMGATALAAGSSHTIALMPNGTLRAAGANGDGQLGNYVTSASEPTPVIPLQFFSIPLDNVTAIAAGANYTAALRQDQTVWTWGSNDDGKLGSGYISSRSQPMPVPGLTDVIALSSTSSHTMVAKSDGTVWGWGLGLGGQLGINTQPFNEAVPTQVLGENAVGFFKLFEPVTGVAVAPTSVSLTASQTATLQANFTPTNATNQAVTWQSSNTSVATVSAAGVVTAKAVGSTTITVTTDDGGKTSTCAVTVTKAPVVEVAPTMSQIVLSRGLAGGARGDVLAVDGKGQLWRYPFLAGNKLGAAQQVGSGWAQMRLFAPGDWNGDGRADLVGVTKDGKMMLYPGNGKGGIGKGVQIGHGWSSLHVIPAGDLTGDGYNDMLAINLKTGVLLLYAGNGKGGFKSGYKQVGHGWKSMQLFAAGDLNRDGKTDILGVKADGTLLFYAGKGTGFFHKAQQVGHGWTGMTLAAGADLNGDGKADIVGRTKDLRLLYYQGKGIGTFQPSIQIGKDW